MEGLYSAASSCSVERCLNEAICGNLVAATLHSSRNGLIGLPTLPHADKLLYRPEACQSCHADL